MAEVTDRVGGPDSLGARIRALQTLDPGKLGALAATADALQRRAEAAESKTVEWVPGAWWVVQAPDGSAWRETNDEAEARAAMRPGDTLLRQYFADAPDQYRVVDVAPPTPRDGEGNTFAHG